jgi:hypothetical protein
MRLSVASAISGSSAVVNLVGILSQSGRQTYTAIHVEGARRVALAAKNAGVLRLISALGAAMGLRHLRTAPKPRERRLSARHFRRPRSYGRARLRQRRPFLHPLGGDGAAQ